MEKMKIAMITTINTQNRQCESFALNLPFLPKAYDFKSLSFSCFDPLESLELGVNHQRPALSVCQDGGILNGHAVAGEVFIIPASDGSSISQKRENIQTLCHWNRCLDKKIVLQLQSHSLQYYDDFLQIWAH